MSDKTTFLNVDLDVSSREDLAALAAAPHDSEFRLTEATVRMVGKVRGRIVFTVYGAASRRAEPGRVPPSKHRRWSRD